MKVLTILDNGFEELEAIGTITLLKRAGILVDIATFNKTEQSGSHDLTLSNIKDFNDINPDEYDLLFIPGGRHYQALSKNKVVLNLILKYASMKKIAAICAAPTILGHLGLLKGVNYTCFTSLNEDFGGNYTNTYAVKDKNIITGKSAAAVIEFAFLIIEELLGEEKAEAIKNQIYYEK